MCFFYHNLINSRRENRRECIDLQTFVIQVPETTRKHMTHADAVGPPTDYPLALVPGQFQEYYRKIDAAELLYVV